MTGWLLYDSHGAERNRWFIDSFLKQAPLVGIELELKVVSGLNDLTGETLPDFAIVRTIDPELNRFFETRGIPSFNNSQTSRVANDKWATYTLCRHLGIPVMETVLLPEQGEDLPMEVPFVLKSRNGHGGTEVFLIRSREEYAAKLGEICRKNYIAQCFCSQPGTDMRVYVLGGQTLAGMLRTSEKDFRSNFSLGGDAAPAAVAPEQQAVISQLYNALDFDFVGVDFIRHHGHWILNEIEDVVGTRMLYRYTQVDSVMLYLEHIQKYMDVRKAL